MKAYKVRSYGANSETQICWRSLLQTWHVQNPKAELSQVQNGLKYVALRLGSFRWFCGLAKIVLRFYFQQIVKTPTAGVIILSKSMDGETLVQSGWHTAKIPVDNVKLKVRCVKGDDSEMHAG